MNNMQFKIPKSDKYHWTHHSIYKMRQYGLSAQRVARVIRNPERTEEGIVPKTIAVMQPASVKYKNFKKTWSQEIWVMYQLRGSGAISKSQFPTRPPARQVSNKIPKSKFQKNIHNTKYIIHDTAKRRLRIISAWRYPGISPKNNPIPEEILGEIKGII